MPRSKGFTQEDYELCEKVNDATNGRLRPSEACDLAEAWIQKKLKREAADLWDLGYHDASRTLSNFSSKLERGIH